MSCVPNKETPTGFAEEFDHLHSYQCRVLHSRKEGTKPNKVIEVSKNFSLKASFSATIKHNTQFSEKVATSMHT